MLNTVRQELSEVSIIDINVDKIFMIWLAFGYLFGFNELNID